MKKYIQISLALLASVILASSARAADVSHGVVALDLTSNVSTYGGRFATNLAGGLFTDAFTFTLSKASTLDADVTSTAALTRGLDITDFRLLSASGQVVYQVNQVSTGIVDLWKIKALSLEAGNYKLEVLGTVNSAYAGSYSGNVRLQALPVPEANTYAMLIGGLVLFAALGLRRGRR